MFLGIEIGGTKLQLGVGSGEGAELLDLERRVVDRSSGAEGIRSQIETLGRVLIERHACRAVGIGFGGPVDRERGLAIKSHQVDGWEEFPLCEWCRRTLGIPAAIENDAETAGLAEALLGAGRGASPALYVTVGTGIGGGLIVGGRIYRGSGRGAAEIGHLRPWSQAKGRTDTVESIASGPGIAKLARARLEELKRTGASRQVEVDEFLERCASDLSQVDARLVGALAAEGNSVAREILEEARETLGWALAQAVTLLAPEVVILGGGVSLMGEELFLDPLREVVERYVFPPFSNTYRLVPAALGEEVVVHGALVVAKSL